MIFQSVISAEDKLGAEAVLASVAVSSSGHVTNQQTLQVRRFVICRVNDLMLMKNFYHLEGIKRF